MKHDRLETMIKGWFVGDFSPVAHQSPHVEVAIKHYAKGDHEGAHYHAVATELTAIVTGRVRMMGREWEAGDIITLGTPGGCGYQTRPTGYLHDGDVVECRATGVGSIVNPVVLHPDSGR